MLDSLSLWLHETPLGETLLTMLISMLPVVELRGGLPAGVAVFMVEDTLLAYQQLAHAYRLRKQGLKVFAITGSNGKTSTKDLLAACLSCKYNVVKTQGNFNNEIGLPKTLLLSLIHISEPTRH